jgi:hypothetical protein
LKCRRRHNCKARPSARHIYLCHCTYAARQLPGSYSSSELQLSPFAIIRAASRARKRERLAAPCAAVCAAPSAAGAASAAARVRRMSESFSAPLVVG